MILRRIAVFSGFDGRVVERIRPTLEAQQTDVAVVKLPPTLDRAYFEQLFERFWAVAQSRLTDDQVRYVGVLVSAVDGDEVAVEQSVFFPTLRRLSIEKAFRKDINGAARVGARIIQLLASAEFLESYKRVRPASDAVLSLPIENCQETRLSRELLQLYNLEKFEAAPALDRFIQRLRKGAGLRSHGLQFKGCTNDPSHPVRRVTDCICCDAEGRFRLGFSIPARFEFDVSCQSGLSGKTFKLCSGSAVRITGSPTHLNMRINGDFIEG